jgi:hypothetical protein
MDTLMLPRHTTAANLRIVEFDVDIGLKSLMYDTVMIATVMFVWLPFLPDCIMSAMILCVS